MDGLFAFALAVGASYWPVSTFALPGMLLVVWKGAGVALLALWAARRTRGGDGWLLVAVLALGAAGDVLLALKMLAVGAVAFLLGHIVAVALYLRTRRAEASWMWVGLAPATALLAFYLPAHRADAPGVAVYAFGLGAMAAAAAMSRFRLAALGAGLFVASDLLLFARMGPLGGSPVPGLLIWPLYFAGQALVAWSVGRCVAPGTVTPT